MRWRLCVLTVAVLVLLAAAPARAEKRVALVIGNAAYKEAPLKNPANDAKDIADALKRLGFDVTLKVNAGLSDMDRAVQDFGRSLRQGGVGIFYFAGHGLQVGGDNYLVPVDANIESESDVKFKCLNAGLVLGKMEDAGNSLNIVILDACRNNPFARSFRSAGRGLAKMDAPKGSMIAYATAPGATAADGEGRNGVYTKHLLDNLLTPGLHIQDVFLRTRVGVLRETSEKQIPWEATSITGYFYLYGQPGAAPVVVAAQPAPQVAAVAPEKKDKTLGEIFSGLFGGKKKEEPAPVAQPAPAPAPAPVAVTPQPAPAPVIEPPAPPEPPKAEVDLESIKKKDKESKKKWAAWQAGMNKAFGEVQALEKDKSVGPEAKAEAWYRLAQGYAEDNPYSGEDEALRKKIQARLDYWNGEVARLDRDRAKKRAEAQSVQLAALPPRVQPGVGEYRGPELRGLKVQIVHTAQRKADAERAAEILRGKGVEVRFTQTDDSGNEPHLRALYMESDRYRDAAAEIARLVSHLEPLSPALTKNPELYRRDGVQFNLWMASPKAGAGGDFAGFKVKVLYTTARKADADRAVEILRGRGADAFAEWTSDDGNDRHVGKVYLMDWKFRQNAEETARLLAGVEPLTPTLHDPQVISDPKLAYLGGKYLTVWVVGQRGGGAVASGRSLQGFKVRIVHIAQRKADAERAEQMLRAQGADTELHLTSDDGNEKHTGRVYLMDWKFRPAAEEAARLVAGIESVTPALHDEQVRNNPKYAYLNGRYLTVWVTSPRGGGAVASGRFLEGFKVRVVYIAQRKADAERAEQMLRAQGADTELHLTSDDGNDRHAGRVYLMDWKFRPAAEETARLLSGIESLTPALHDEQVRNNSKYAYLNGRYLTVWVANPRPTGVAPGVAGERDLIGTWKCAGGMCVKESILIIHSLGSRPSVTYDDPTDSYKFEVRDVSWDGSTLTFTTIYTKNNFTTTKRLSLRDGRLTGPDYTFEKVR
jgi:hypothetical protein